MPTVSARVSHSSLISCIDTIFTGLLDVQYVGSVLLFVLMDVAAPDPITLPRLSPMSIVKLAIDSTVWARRVGLLIPQDRRTIKAGTPNLKGGAL